MRDNFAETSNLALAAYAHMRGMKVVKARKWQDGKMTRYSFTFLDNQTEDFPNGRFDILQIDFANSESLGFDSSVRTLKKLCNAAG